MEVPVPVAQGTPAQGTAPDALLPQLSEAVGLGDSFGTFRARHGLCTGPAGSQLALDPEGSASLIFCEQTFYMLNSIRGVVQSLTHQYEARQKLPRREAEQTVLSHTPRDRQRVRSYTDSIGQEVTVYTSAGLARNLPDPAWYRGHPVGTFSVLLQRVPRETTYFGAMAFSGVDYDENDPGRVE
jgi:hypothetical protein